MQATTAVATASRPVEGHPDAKRTVGAAVQYLVLAVPAVWIAVMAWRYRWITEDGFIYLRIADQLASGNGPVFNAGERVEAYTGPAWVAILAAGELLSPIRFEWLAVWLGLLATVGGVLLATLGARRLWQPIAPDRLYLPVGAAVFVAIFPTWGWATGGLETGLVFLWLGWCTWILATWSRAADANLSWWRLVVLGAGWVIRPELMLASLAFLVLLLVSARGRRSKARVVLLGLAVPVAYQLFRMAYFGSLVANTAIAKEGSRLRVGRGWRYLLDFAEPYWLWVPAVALVVLAVPLVRRCLAARTRRPVGVVAALVGSGLLNAVYVVAVGGDYHHARMFLPGLFACCAPFAAVPVARAASIVASGAVAVWVAVAIATLRPDQLTSGNWLANGFIAQDPQMVGNVTVEEIGWARDQPNMAWYTGEDGYYLQTPIGTYSANGDVILRGGGPDQLAAFWGIGVGGFAPGIDLDVFDQMGLAAALPSHLDITGQPERYPGHEKPLPAPWVAALVTASDFRPTPEQFPNFGAPLLPPATGAEFDEQVAWARAALECDEIVELLDASTEPLGPGRLLDNVFGSFHYTFLRIPPDPEDAYHEFCGPGVPPEVEAARGTAGGG